MTIDFGQDLSGTGQSGAGQPGVGRWDVEPARLRELYDAQLRAWVPDRLPAGTVVERDGPIVRIAGLDERGFVTYISVAGAPDLDALIARQRDYFAGRRLAVEWKLHGHDVPADLPHRLVAAGFQPEEQETVVIGPAQPLAGRPAGPPSGIRLREVTARRDLERVAAMESSVWNKDRSFLAESLAQEIAADASGTTIVVAETDVVESRVVSAGWVRYVGGTVFATLWGGSTLPEFRGRGIYTALVRYRAALAVAPGHTMLQVDASDDSRPILQRLGFVAVTTTTPYVYDPAAGRS